ncbi:MAG TPA: hypothetical protein DHU55_06755 [Blastocatellia bacterium]|jgi:heavy metal sensor kinase|nr:hypothetical protein [Blastocatellia bacterium]
MLDSVRTRLTLWYAAVLALSLVVFALLTYFVAARSFARRQDESLRSTAETVASAYMQELSEEGSIAKANEVVSQMVYPNRFVEVTDADGHAIALSSNLNQHALALSSQALEAARRQAAGYDVANSFAGDDEGLRLAVVPLSVEKNKQTGFAVVAESRGVIDEELERMREGFFAAVPIILLLASAGGYFLARKSLSPIALMDQQTRRITVENLSSRLEAPNPRDELGRLATTINELLGRLDAAFKEQQRFIADASHELRTPVAVLRGEAEISLERDRPANEYKDSLKLIGEEAERLSRIVEDLFTLAHQPVESYSLAKEPLYLNEVIAECVRAARVLATRKGLLLNTGALSEVSLLGDEELLKRMLLNLLDNAVKYTPEGGRISVALERNGHFARISVTDTGIGIPMEDQSRIFDRFYRVDKPRSRALGGAGLGLSIVRWIVDAHGGSLALESEIGRGSSFFVTLPLTS